MHSFGSTFPDYVIFEKKASASQKRRFKNVISDLDNSIFLTIDDVVLSEI